MRIASAIILLATLAGCGRGPTSVGRSLPPPSLDLSGATRIMTSNSGQAELEVSAKLNNRTSVHILVGTGSQCPLYIHLVPDSSGEFFVGPGRPDACPASALTLDLAPGDSAIVTDVIGANALASFTPGVFAVNVGIVSSTTTIVAWAGAIRLPLVPRS